MRDSDHEQFQRLLSGYAMDALNDVEWLLMHTHVSECERCQAELGRPELPHRAAPKVIPPAKPASRYSTRPGWPVVFGVGLVTALVAFGLGYAVAIVA